MIQTQETQLDYRISLLRVSAGDISNEKRRQVKKVTITTTNRIPFSVKVGGNLGRFTD
jgi:hypothetical protein